MEFLADFHVHSRYSRATSKDLSLESLHQAALEKGLTVVGTGDFTHPGWMEEIRQKLVPAEEGLFRLREDLAREAARGVPAACRAEVRFILTAEISNIYKRGGRVRKVHNLIFADSLDTALEISGRLERIGNIASDGRPILGLDSRDLLEIVLESSSEAFLVPAHIWTPWFSVLGSKSGFDSITECFGDLIGEIFSVETGLSSDPAMNWRLSSLDRFALMSNSDAHSAARLGRESNRFDCELSFGSIKKALRDRKGFLGTIEFFPEQGKYHFDGHRKCQQRMCPAETRQAGGICPVCGKKVTVGVMYRVEELADRPQGARPEGAPGYDRLVSLAEVIGEVREAGPSTKGVQKACRQLLQRLGPELFILTKVPLEEIERKGGSLLAEGIGRIRRAEVQVEEGYDGEFGIVRIFAPGERARLAGQGTLAGLSAGPDRGSTGRPDEQSLLEIFPGPARQGPERGGRGPEAARVPEEEEDLPGPLFSVKGPPLGSADVFEGLNPEQAEAVRFSGAPLLIIAGPGTGKTLTLTCRIAHLVRACGVPPERVLAVTFTQRAAREMEERLEGLFEGSGDAARVCVRTFHALGAELLREAGPELGIPPDFYILDRHECRKLLMRAMPSVGSREADRLLEQISRMKRAGRYPEDGMEALDGDEALWRAFDAYERLHREYRALDYDDLVSRAVRVMDRRPGFAEKVRQRFSAVCVDEYQDVNLAQYRLLRALCGDGEGLCAIGDPDQAIYGFRGASPAYFLQFERDYPRGRTVRLVTNYRSTPTILAASRAMLAAGDDRAETPALVPTCEEDTPIRTAELPTDKSEAIFIAQTIERLMGGTDSLSLYSDQVAGHEAPGCSSFGDVAILYRLKALEPMLAFALRHQGIPFQRAGQEEQVTGPEGRALLAVIRWLRDPGDRMAYEEILEAAKARTGDVRGSMEVFRAAWGDRSRTVREGIEALDGLDWIPLEEEPWREAWELLVRMSVPFGEDWDAYLRTLLLSHDADFVDRKAERVTLATLHAAKGLEFAVVFIAGCEDDLLPCQVSASPVDMEEERRLFYVGMTRACRLLYLTWARSRLLYGQRRSGGPSRFLQDLPRERLVRVRLLEKGPRRRTRDDAQPSLFKLPT